MYEETSLTGRLNSLYHESRLSIDKFAKSCKVSYGAMCNYLNGTRVFPSEKIPIVCSTYSVSADWLLGLSDVRTTSADLQNAIATLGITEAAAQKLTAPQVGNPWGKTLSKMIEARSFENLLTSYKMYLTFVEKLKESDLNESTPWLELNEDNVVLGINEAANHFKQEVQTAMTHVLEDNYRDKVQEIIQDIPTPFSMEMEPGKYVIRRE